MDKDQATIRIEDIRIGERFRKEYKNIDELAKSLNDIGQITPIAVRPLPKSDQEDGKKWMLLAGGRRLRALQQNGQSVVLARLFDSELTMLRCRRVELAENVDRDNLTWQEKVDLIAEIHKLGGEISGKAPTIAETAAEAKKSPGTISEALELAKLKKARPELERCESYKDAQKILRKAKETVIKGELARRTEERIKNTSSDKLKTGMIDSYVIGDFFQLVKKIPAGSFDMIDCDPPYAINLDNIMERRDGNFVGKSYVEFKPDELEAKEVEIGKELFRVTKEHAWCLHWCSEESTHIIRSAMKKAGWKPLGMLVFPKSRGTRSMNPTFTFQCDYEVAIYCRKGNAQLQVNAPSSIINWRQEPSTRHPAQKPVYLMKELFSKFCAPGSNVLIPFVGSGNSIIAATELSMFALGFDLDEERTHKSNFVLAVNEWTPVLSGVEKSVESELEEIEV